MDPVQPKEVRVLETVEDIVERRTQVLTRYSAFRHEALNKRCLLEDSRHFQYFKRDGDELESWINEKLQTACDESWKDTTNLQAKMQKHQAFEAEVSAHSNAILDLDSKGQGMINDRHFASDVIAKRLEDLHSLWALLLSKLGEKGIKLQQALILVHFMRQAEEILTWISEKEAILTSDETIKDLEHVEVLQRKFDEVMKDLAGQELKVAEVKVEAERIVSEQHPESESIMQKQDQVVAAWNRLKQVAVLRQERLYAATQIQRFNRDADETIGWIMEKDAVISSDDMGRDLISCQALQRKHEAAERDLAALEDKVLLLGNETERLCQLYPDQVCDFREFFGSFWEFFGSSGSFIQFPSLCTFYTVPQFVYFLYSPKILYDYDIPLTRLSMFSLPPSEGSIMR